MLEFRYYRRGGTMKNRILLFILILLSSCSQWDAIKKKPMDLDIILAYKSEGYAPRKVSLSQGHATIYLELGDELGEIRLDENADYRIHQETQTSVSIMDEGPHLDLTDWVHGVQETQMRMSIKKNVFLFNPNYKSIVFPEVTNEELLAAVSSAKAFKDSKESDAAKKRWITLAKTCKDVNSYPCGVAPSLYRFKISKKIGEEWYLVGTLDVIPPMGC